MDLYCSVCFFIDGEGDTKAEIIKDGYSLCEAHAWVRGPGDHATAITEGSKRSADDESDA